MEIKIKSKNLNLSDGQKNTIHDKVVKLQHLADLLSDESTEIRAEIRHEQSRKAEDAYICQLTIFAPNTVIRSETRNNGISNAVDECIDKIKGQIERYKAKMHRVNKKHINKAEVMPVVTEEEELPKVFKRKRFSDSNPMTEEDAIDKMELVGHGFFLFNNADTGRFSVVYKRDDGYYGIIEPKMEND